MILVIVNLHIKRGNISVKVKKSGMALDFPYSAAALKSCFMEDCTYRPLNYMQTTVNVAC